MISLALERLRLKEAENNARVIFDTFNVELTEKELDLAPADIEEDDEQLDLARDVSEEFEKYFGTSIKVEMPDIPYLGFDCPVSEQQAQLKRILNSKSEKIFSKKLAVPEEKEYQLSAYRVSRRQRKKENKVKSEDRLAKWFGMPRVTEISKQQEKDLLALRMRRVWDPKQFYKKSSTVQAASDRAGVDSSRYFQVGTILDSPTDYYSGRIVRKNRKQTIIDELMNDAQVRAYNKRKLHYAMSKNSRLTMLMKRTKLKRQKRKIRDRKAAKSRVPIKQPNTFRTFDL